MSRITAPVGGEPQPLGAVVEALRCRPEQVLRIGEPAPQPGEMQPPLVEQPREAS